MDSHIIRVLAQSEVDDSWRQQEMYYQSGLVKNVAAGRNAPSKVAGDLQEGGGTRQQQLIAIECVRVGPYARIHYQVRRQSSAAGNPLLVQSLLAQTLNQRPRKRGGPTCTAHNRRGFGRGFHPFRLFCLPALLAAHLWSAPSPKRRQESSTNATLLPPAAPAPTKKPKVHSVTERLASSWSIIFVET